MLRRIPDILAVGALLALFILPARAEDATVRVGGPLSTKPLLMALSRGIKKDKDLTLVLAAALTSADALEALAKGEVDIALIARPFSGEDKALYPDMDLVPVPIGMEAVALGVSGDIWDARIHTMSKETMRDIYEHKITNWHDLGGPDEKITMFNVPEGQGVLEILTEWLYEDNRKAPLPKGQKVPSSADARDALEFTPGGLAALSASFVDGTRCHALGIDNASHISWVLPKDVASGAYPIVRPLIAVVVGKPALSIRIVTDYLKSPAGQDIVKKSGNLGTEAVPTPTPDPYY